MFLLYKPDPFFNHLDGVDISLLVSSGVSSGSFSGQVKQKTIKLLFFCFSAKHAALKNNTKGWVAQSVAIV